MQWSELSTELATYLKDTGGTTFPDTLRMRAFNRAAQFFASTHTAQLRTLSVTASAHSSGMVVSLPADFMELPDGGVQVGTKFLEPAIISPGDDTPKDGYMPFADKVLIFKADVTDVTLWYFGGYNTITGPTSIVDLPQWATWAIINLSLAYCLYPEMVGQAKLRQFQSPREEGKPEDNPMRRQAAYFRQTYEEIVSKYPPQDRGYLYRPGLG